MTPHFAPTRDRSLRRIVPLLLLVGPVVGCKSIASKAPAVASPASPAPLLPVAHPARLTQPAPSRPAALTASDGHTCIIVPAAGAPDRDPTSAPGQRRSQDQGPGDVSCWGRNSDEQLGMGGGASSIAVPTRATVIDHATAIAAAFYDTCAVRAGGTVRCWGTDGYLLGHEVGLPTGAVADVDGLREVTDIAAGSIHACARTRDGAVWCWGANDRRHSGVADEKPVVRPSRIALAGRAVAVTAGWSHACALVDGGEVWCWGENFYGQLGGGDGFNADRPVRVDGLADAVSIAAGRRHTCAVRAGGQVLC